MNCLLVMPSSKRNDGDYGMYYDFPMGIAYISGAMKRLPGIRTIPVNLNQIPGEQTAENRCRIIAEMIEKESVDVVLTGGLFVFYERIREVIETAKKVSESIVTVVGGGIISGDPEASMEALEFADYGVIGEGEITVAELCAALLERRSTESIQGLIRKKDGKLATTGPRAVIKDFSQLPWCDYEAFGMAEYLDQSPKISFEANHPWMAKPSLPVLTSRSCPQMCTFCFHPEGSGYRRRDLDDVFAELDAAVEKYRPGSITMSDALVCMPQPMLENFCRRIAKYNIPWLTSFRVNDITESTVRLLKSSNCRTIGLGLESASERILRSMKKGMTVVRMEEALNICREQRVYAFGGFLFGDPEETYETCMETLEWYLAHPLFAIFLSELWYYPGSDIYWRAVRAGKIPDRVRYLRNNVTGMAFNFTKMPDAEFNDIIKVKIPEYRAKRQALLPELQDASASNAGGIITLAGKCGCCGNSLTFRNLSPLQIQSSFLCTSCVTPLAVPALEHVGFVQRNLDYLLDRYGEIAIWGIGARFKSVMTPRYLEDPRIHLVDRNSGGRYGGKPIESLEIISRRRIRTVISPPRSDNAFPGTNANSRDLFSEIAAEAKEKYGALRVFDLFDLWFRDLRESGA